MRLCISSKIRLFFWDTELESHDMTLDGEGVG